MLSIKLKHFDDVIFRELFVRISVSLQNKDKNKRLCFRARLRIC